jgi:iron-sulfur cluster repair protein YtfE (RIC family)
MHKPIKRHQSLKPISREHHRGLLLSWKIREGLRLNIPVKRIKKYVEWFWVNHLASHFEFEEKFVFPILGNENHLIVKALYEHARLESLFQNSENTESNLSLIEKELVAHIRFEERILFKEIELMATKEQLNQIEKEHQKNIADTWADEFWVKL